MEVQGKMDGGKKILRNVHFHKYNTGFTILNCVLINVLHLWIVVQI